MKTDKEIFDDWCIIKYKHRLNYGPLIKFELNSYGFAQYKCKIRWKEFIDTIKQTIFKKLS